LSGPADLRSRILRRFEGSEPKHELADWRLLGVDAERVLKLQKHFPANPVPAAVLVPFVDRPEGLSILLTQRASQLANHAAQVSFPGGRLEESDPDVASAALREAQEEIGLDPADVTIFGEADSYRTVTGYCVTPVVGLVPPGLELTPNPAEVAGWFEAPLDFVLDPANQRRMSAEFRGRTRHYYQIDWQGRRIWGATAAMLFNLLERMGHA